MNIVLALAANALANFLIGLLVAHLLSPEEFGRFALTLAAGGLLQLAGFEWLRLCAARFHSTRSALEKPEIRATLDAGFVACAIALLSVGALALLGGLTLAMSQELLALAIVAGVINALFDYLQALARARFEDRLFARMVLTKSLLSLAITLSAAWWTGSAIFAVAGLCIAMGGSIATSWGRFADAKARENRPQWALTSQFLLYAKPVVAATLLYYAMAYFNRLLMAERFGYAEAGHFSLAFDLSQRILQSIGTMLDVLLFQMAVRAHEQLGPDAARQQARRNCLAVLAILMPATLGLWLVLPSLETVLAPQEFRGAFAQHVIFTLPGLLCFGLITSAVAPFYQLARRTTPLIMAAMIACGVDLALIALLPASPQALSMALSGGFAAGLIWLVIHALWLDIEWPAMRDLMAITFSTAIMGLMQVPLMEMKPGLATLAVQILCGILVYGGLIALWDVGGLRRAITIARTKPV
jgi:O-antigen/teichoic acid export membrane protein